MRTNSNLLFALCILFINILRQSHCFPCPNEIWLNETIATGENVYDFQTCTLTGGTCPEDSPLTMECYDLTDPLLLSLGVSGNLSIVALKALDREDRDMYTLRCYVSANDTGCNTFDFVLHINDVNDNAPMFSQPTYTISIFETDSVFENRIKISDSSIVSDVDLDPYSEFIVELFDSALEIQDVFNLITSNDLTGVYYIENAKKLDRELQSYYNLTLLAKDVLNNSLSSTAQLIIEIGDLNDNGPMIVDDVVNIIVPEDTEIGAIVGRVAVTDLDVYPNNQMNFYLNTICSYATSSIDFLLILNSNTGVFTLKYDVDAENVVASLDAMVIVIDPTVDNRFDCAPIRVEISDVNDNTPEISVTRTTESVVEETDNNLEIVTFIIIDRDSLENGRVDMDFNCSTAFDCSQYFRLERYPPLFTFVMQQPLDYELTSQVDITFEYFDNGTIRNGGIYELTLPVIPVNEFAPEFPSYEISCLVGEDVRVGEFICKEARATDMDAGIDGYILYSIFEETALPSIDVVNQNFMFDTTGNYLVLLKEFDFEMLSSNETNFFFKVNASNIDGKHSIAEISIRFIDVNDNAPYIESIDSSFEISEATPRGFKVVTLQTGDLDSGENGRVTVSLLSADPVPFVVEYSEGWVLVTDAILDRESRSSYNLALVATDHGDTSLSSEILNFSITLLDENDNRPYFENSMYTFTLIMANDTWRIPVIDRDSEVIAEIRLDFGDNMELGSALIVDDFTRHIILINPSAIIEGSYDFTIYVHDPILSSEETSIRCTFLYRPDGTGLPDEDTSLAPIIAGVGLSILLFLILIVTISIFCLMFFILRRRTHRVKYQPRVRRRKNPSLHLPASILKPNSKQSEGKKKVSFNSNVHLMTFRPHKGSSSETSYSTSDVSNEEQANQWPKGANRDVHNRIIEAQCSKDKPMEINTKTEMFTHQEKIFNPESWIPTSQLPYHQSRRQDLFTNSTSSEGLDTKDSNAPLIEPNHVYYQNTQEVMISNRHAHNYNMLDTNQVQTGYNCYENQVTSSEESDVMRDNVHYNPMHDGMDSENSDDSERPPYGAVPLYISSDMTSEGDLSTGVCSDYDTNMSNQAEYCMTNIPSDSYDGEITV